MQDSSSVLLHRYLPLLSHVSNMKPNNDSQISFKKKILRFVRYLKIYLKTGISKYFTRQILFIYVALFIDRRSQSAVQLK